MAILPQSRLFSWENLENLDDLHRLRLVLEAVPDEPLMRLLERARGRGRDDYPVRAVWNSLLAGVVYQHPSVASLRRELLRSASERGEPASGTVAERPAASGVRVRPAEGRLGGADAAGVHDVPGEPDGPGGGGGGGLRPPGGRVEGGVAGPGPRAGVRRQGGADARVSAWPERPAAGHMTSGPKPADETARIHMTYDAWNRLVAVRADDAQNPGQPGDLVATCRYDARGRRIQKIVAGNPDITYDYYYSGYQVVEVRKGGDADPLEQYVWDGRYVHSPVLRWRDANTDGDLDDEGDSVLYYTNDANFNMTALVAADGDVAERVVYDPYGKPTFLKADWTLQEASGHADGTASAYANEILFTGHRRDAETGLYVTLHRTYHPTLGRWLQRDRIGYADGMGLYQYARSRPACATDPSGLIEGCSKQNEGDTRCLVDREAVFTPVGVHPDTKKAGFEILDGLAAIQLVQAAGGVGTAFTKGLAQTGRLTQAAVEGVCEATSALANKGMETAAGTGDIPKDIIKAWERILKKQWGVDMYVRWRCERCRCVDRPSYPAFPPFHYGSSGPYYDWAEESSEWYRCDRQKLQERIQEKKAAGEEVFDPLQLMPHQHPDGMGIHQRGLGGKGGESGYLSPGDARLYLPMCLEEAMKACEEECYCLPDACT